MEHQESTLNPLKPPLKWAGGKRWLVPHLKPLWEKHRHRRLVEPFCGGLAVTLGLMPSKALLNDINPHVINFFRWLQQGLEITLPMLNDRVTYYKYRERFNQLIAEGKAHTKEAAELFYYLNRTGYNGLCRFNSSGKFNVPFGKYKQINYKTDFSEYKRILKYWKFTYGDFENVQLKPDDFVYADPPYDVEFTQYSKKDFKWEDQVRLAQWLAEHKGPIVLSNQKTHRIVKLYKELGFKIHYLKAPRMISCNGNRTPATEVLAVKGI
ncbi:MAG: Dam family site-specific DNA-(adenine-N6)-methyltransferase [Clostridia bacterium]|nr:Dam family site-specific DNA-(adenine-N6)-methyltransferase [Clostridia bacterium]